MLKVEIANTPYKLEKGLMFRKDLPDDQGMLFQFKKAEVLKFWGLNTYVPLDIAFLDTNSVIIKIDKIKPFSTTSVSSEKIAAGAIEANLGYFATNGIKVGDKALLKKQENDLSILKFESPQVKTSQVNKIKPDSDNSIVNNDLIDQNDANLPVLGEDDINQYLIDNQEDETPPTEQSTLPEQIPEEIPQTEEVPQEQPTTEEQKEYPSFGSVFEAAKWAANNLEVIRINYRTEHGKTLTRDVEPHGTYYAKTTHRAILVTFDETAGNIRAFILRNVGQYSFIGRKFKKKFQFKT